MSAASFTTKPSACPHCGKRLDRATAADPADKVPPEPGSLSICIGCGAVLIFGADLTLEACPASVLSAMPPPLRAVIDRARTMIRSRGDGR
jgi:hypothetical protein